MYKISFFIKKTVPSIHAWLSQFIYGPKRYKHLYKSIKKNKAKKILEIGVWNGKRALKMIETAQKFNSDIEYYGFDLFEELSEAEYVQEMSKRPPAKQKVEALLSATGAKINLFSGNTLESLPENINTLPQMDFIFIDGGHSNETVLSDWMFCSKLMGANTVLIFDDYWRNRIDGGSKLTVDSIDREKYDVEILPEVDSFDNPDFGRLDISFAKVVLK